MTPPVDGRIVLGEDGGVDDVVARHVVVRGTVQGVGFRYRCERAARDAGVHGWVRNRSDGAVEASFEGSPAAVAGMVEWMRHGPRHASVEDVDVDDREPTGTTGFTIR